MALTARKRLFADAVMRGKSNKDAAIEAGYSAATASAAGSRLVKDPVVNAYLNKCREETKVSSGEVANTPFDINRALQYSDPRAFLLATMNDPKTEDKLRVDAAKALMPFMHKKLGEGGKKDARDEEAKKVASRFPAAAPPRLAASGGKKL
ncbi:terminase small subunit [Herbaspirillum frisingense]|uniref:Phage terminase small subunit n=1 Tax=Herbaspirillum frisingense TaxID=92645 RepID=A0ABU1PHW7_9BURK|nr:terminase small subunit [Herbaspirillum frisingense]MDR6585537.1 phage terminase small subunit [Herbaspirillum frisingense]